jgi:hypothetical protein
MCAPLPGQAGKGIRREEGRRMRMRADQVRVGHRLGDAVVTRVRVALDWGPVRITVEPQNTAVEPVSTFSYLPDDILDVADIRRLS